MNFREIGEELLHLELKEKYFKKFCGFRGCFAHLWKMAKKESEKQKQRIADFMNIQQLLNQATWQKQLTWKGS